MEHGIILIIRIAIIEMQLVTTVIEHGTTTPIWILDTTVIEHGTITEQTIHDTLVIIHGTTDIITIPTTTEEGHITAIERL